MENIILEITCPFCGQIHYVECLESEFQAYMDGALAQDAFTTLSVTEREQIVSRICPECQEKIFG